MNVYSAVQIVTTERGNAEAYVEIFQITQNIAQRFTIGTPRTTTRQLRKVTLE